MGNNIIEINGKRYDAQSGTLLGDSSVKTATKQHVAHRGRVIDGFVKPGAAITAYSPSTAPKTVPKPVTQRPVKRVTSHLKAGHQPQKAKTLMRHVVSKPTVQKKQPIKVQQPSELAAAPVTHIAPSHKVAAHNVNERRLARARTYNQHRTIQRFTTTQQNYPVARGMQAQRQNPQAALPASELVHNTAAPSGHQTTHQPAHNTGNKTQPPHSQHHKNRSSDLFEAAMANARSHEQPAHKPKKKASHKVLNIAAGLAAFVALAGFVAYTNMSNIEVRIASMRAGFTAQLPAYNPTGYALEGGPQAQRGMVTLKYRSGANTYTLQQQSSDWDSQTLSDNIDGQATEKTETLSAAGRTVYVYGDNAAWVNGGVLYSMKTAGDISNQEILAIATSI